jgi:capsular polysaccharide biosynthesis protein
LYGAAITSEGYVELNEAVRRILGRHRLLIGSFVLLGCLVGVMRVSDTPLHAATVRLVLDADDPGSQAESQAIADTARGIATGPALVREALSEISADRDTRVVAERQISVEALGSSGVLALTVTDRDPRVAVSLANAVAEAVIATRTGISAERISAAFQEIDAQVADVEGQIESKDETLSSIAARIEEATTVDGLRTLEALRTEVERQRAFLEQRRLALETARANIAASQADRPQASIVDAASPPALSVPSPVPVAVGIGALLGLLVGVAIAAARETFSPTVVGASAIERVIEAPVLGRLRGRPDRADVDLGVIPRHIALASATANVDRVEVIGVDPNLDVRAFSSRLRRSMQAAGTGAKLQVLPLTYGSRWEAGSESAVPPEKLSRSNGHRRSALLLVLPEAVKRASLDPVFSLRGFSGSSILGAVVYPTQGRRVRDSQPVRLPAVKHEKAPKPMRDKPVEPEPAVVPDTAQAAADPRPRRRLLRRTPSEPAPELTEVAIAEPEPAAVAPPPRRREEPAPSGLPSYFPKPTYIPQEEYAQMLRDQKAAEKAAAAAAAKPRQLADPEGIDEPASGTDPSPDPIDERPPSGAVRDTVPHAAPSANGHRQPHAKKSRGRRTVKGRR